MGLDQTCPLLQRGRNFFVLLEESHTETKQGHTKTPEVLLLQANSLWNFSFLSKYDLNETEQKGDYMLSA